MKETIKMLAIYLLIIFVAIGCSTTKKDTKAVSRVLAKVELVDTVGIVWSKQHPCINDTGKPIAKPPIFIKGKDSSFPVFIAKWFNLDTTIQGHHFKIDSTGFHAVFKVCNPDTVLQPYEIPIVDKRALQLEQEAHFKTWQFLQAAIEEKNKSQQSNIKALELANEYRSQRNTSYCIISILGLLIGVGIVLKIKKVI